MKKMHYVILAMLFCCLLAGCQKEAEETAPPCSHQFTAKVTKEASCNETGKQELSCQLCGLSVSLVTPAVDHHFSEIVTREATCAEEGILTTACDLCGVSENTLISPTAHTFDFYSTEPSLCTQCGETVEGAAADPGNPWYGKTWIAMGTSLSSEEYGTYVAPLAERAGMNATSMGIPGGTAIAHILKAVETTDFSKADLITVELGINDWAENVPLGDFWDTDPYLATIDDWTNEGTEEGSFAGGCYQIFTTLQERAPQAVIVLLTDTTGQNFEDESCALEKINSNELLQQEYTEMAMAVARYTGIPVIDAGSTSMINRHHPEYLEDQIHHSELGGKQYALAVWMELKDIAPLLTAE